MEPALENDWLLKAGKIVSVLFRFVLLAFAIVAAVIALLSLIAGLVQAFAPEVLARVSDETFLPIESFGLAALMAVCAVALWLSARFFALLAQIIATVGDGDPFIIANADRLHSMAVINLILFGISLVAAAGVFAFSRVYDELVEDLTLDMSLETLFLAILLFILARVFRHGAAMREDLEGTV